MMTTRQLQSTPVTRPVKGFDDVPSLPVGLPDPDSGGVGVGVVGFLYHAVVGHCVEVFLEVVWEVALSEGLVWVWEVFCGVVVGVKPLSVASTGSIHPTHHYHPA